MATDLACRRLIADAINSFITGDCDNSALDDAISSLNTSDDMCLELRRQTGLFYDDVRRYTNTGKNALRPNAESILRRWEFLLRTGVDWFEIVLPTSDGWWPRFRKRFVAPRLTPGPKFRTNQYWPFPNLKEWELFRDRNSRAITHNPGFIFLLAVNLFLALAPTRGRPIRNRRARCSSTKGLERPSRRLQVFWRRTCRKAMQLSSNGRERSGRTSSPLSATRRISFAAPRGLRFSSASSTGCTIPRLWLKPGRFAPACRSSRPTPRGEGGADLARRRR